MEITLEEEIIAMLRRRGLGRRGYVVVVLGDEDGEATLRTNIPDMNAVVAVLDQVCSEIEAGVETELISGRVQ